MLTPAVQRALTRWTTCGTYATATRPMPTKPSDWVDTISFRSSVSAHRPVSPDPAVRVGRSNLTNQRLREHHARRAGFHDLVHRLVFHDQATCPSTSFTAPPKYTFHSTGRSKRLLDRLLSARNSGLDIPVDCRAYGIDTHIECIGKGDPMKRFIVPRVAHCNGGHQTGS